MVAQEEKVFHGTRIIKNKGGYDLRCDFQSTKKEGTHVM